MGRETAVKGVLLLLGLAGGAKVPVQLNTTAFSACLVLGGGICAHPTPDLPAIKASFGLTTDDGILPYLAVYAGERVTAINATIQQPAWEKFARPFWAHEARLASWLNTTTAAGAAVTPGTAYGAALTSCAVEHSNGTAPFCAGMTLHNTLRALGRSSTFTDAHGVDYLPDWYKADRGGWAVAATQMKETSLINLQMDGGGGCRNTSQAQDDCWGEWYHVAGVIVFSIHEAAVLGGKAGPLADWVFAALNAAWAEAIGHPEDPTKARIDRDAAVMAAAYVTERGVPAGFITQACTDRSGYVNRQ